MKKELANNGFYYGAIALTLGGSIISILEGNYLAAFWAFMAGFWVTLALRNKKDFDKLQDRINKARSN